MNLTKLQLQAVLVQLIGSIGEDMQTSSLFYSYNNQIKTVGASMFDSEKEFDQTFPTEEGFVQALVGGLLKLGTELSKEDGIE